MGNLRGWEWVIIALVVLVLFGAAKLPIFAKNLGKSIRILKDETKGKGDSDAPSADAAPDSSSTDGKRG